MFPRTLIASLAIILFIAGCSSAPAASPTAAPVQQAAAAPTQPAPAPTAVPTAVPTKAPTVAPTTAPTAAPTAAPQAATSPLANFNEVSFDAVTTVAGQTTQSTMSFKGGKFRMEASVMGQQTVIISNTATGETYMWTVGQNQAMKLSGAQAQQTTASAPDLQGLADASKRKLVGTETVEGQLCDVYEIADSASTTKMWISKSNGFPVKAEAVTSMGTVTTVFKNFKTGGLADSLFELPAGMQVMDLGNLMKPGGQMPNLPGGQMPNIPGGQMPNLPGVPTK